VKSSENDKQAISYMGSPMIGQIFVTGGAGFIGSNFIHHWLRSQAEQIINLDKLTYAGNMENLKALSSNPAHVFIHGDINDDELVKDIFVTRKPSAVVHFAAESHVDRSILGPEAFIRTNVNGTFNLLKHALEYWRNLNGPEKSNFRFLHVSTDEVFGSLRPGDPPFTETTPYAPNNPYSASKAASDHLVRSYFHTYAFPALITNCSNNYGPYQFPEKLIPLTISNACKGKQLPVYGNGMQRRDWLFVEDHCKAIATVLRSGRLGETYNIGGSSERNNIDVVRTICAILDEILPAGKPHAKLIKFVKDRPGHDVRYAMDPTKIQRELGWKPSVDFETGVRKTVEWYLANSAWLENVTSGAYQNWIQLQYATP
jgi:dTDP-glucose 4,6-dehydratase